MKKNLLIVVASVLLSCITAYAVVRSARPEQASVSTSYPTDGSMYRTVNLAQTDYPDFTYAAESAVDAVVFVKVTIQSRSRGNYQIDPFFEYFFGYGGDQQPREQQGSGSGVIIRSDGYIVTNNHVVQDATKVEVTLNNNKTYEATVVGTDAATDVALLKIDADGLPSIPFADSDALRLGEWVLAIGSPLGEQLRSTITAGIVSAKGRSMPSNDGSFKIESFIQTDAAVNPGNSGGALINKAGQLVGINTAIVSTTGSFTGYSFAVPSNIVRKIVSDLIDYGAVKRVMLGITGGNLTDELAKELKLSSLDGVYISEVSKGSSADKAGLKKNDVITAVDQAKITTMSSLQEKVNSYHPGDQAQLQIIRDGKLLTVPVTFLEAQSSDVSVAEDGTVAFYGAQLGTPSQETLRRLGARGGVEIKSLSSGKMRDAGATEGFVIVYVNDQLVTKPQDVIDIAKKSRRAIFIEGYTSSGKASYFGFGKDD
ncbi:MAG: Do family serine endopeptidase [Bacteroidales bacterium]|nr:Do family serine endopeptidase [Bacteroidales bacterium]